jgi:ribonuclease HIII
MDLRLLERYAGELAARLAPVGVRLRGSRRLANGLQLEFVSGGSACRVNLYHSERKGFSLVPSGGDAVLSARVTGAGGAAPRGSPRGTWTGSDEAGKGDYLGPLVVCAVYCDEGSAGTLHDLGAVDSKILTARAALEVSAGLEDFLGSAFERAVVGPAEYNGMFDALRMRGMNSNHLLASIHGGAIRALLERGFTPDRFVVDMFCSREQLVPFLPPSESFLELRTGAEDDPAVAAASVLARAGYLEGLAALGREFGTVLVPGAGSEADAAASDLVASNGPEALAKCAKLHFRNTHKVLAEGFHDLT